MARTTPRFKIPPGSLSQSSFSRACRKRKLMRVATTISLGATSRSSRSRFRRSPKFPLAMNRTCLATRPKRGRRVVVSRGGARRRTLAEGVGSPRRHYRRRREGCQTTAGVLRTEGILLHPLALGPTRAAGHRDSVQMLVGAVRGEFFLRAMHAPTPRLWQETL